MLHGQLLPLITGIEDKKAIFQRDNVPIHTVASAKKWFQDDGIELLPWPAPSPDPNTSEDGEF